MPFIPVPNGVLVEFRMTSLAQQVENTLWFITGADPTVVTMTNLGNALETWWATEYSPLVSSGVSLREIALTSMDSITGPQVTIVPSPALAGLNLGAQMPNNISLTVSFRTALRGRSFRGRNYVVGFVEAQIAGNEVNGVDAQNWADAYNAIPGAIAGTTYAWVVASRFSGTDANGDPIPRVTGIATPVTTALVVDTVVDSQRRRLPGRGA
jgi:hypothetical protein